MRNKDSEFLIQNPEMVEDMVVLRMRFLMLSSKL
jgi:hypothetical protein